MLVKCLNLVWEHLYHSLQRLKMLPFVRFPAPPLSGATLEACSQLCLGRAVKQAVELWFCFGVYILIKARARLAFIIFYVRL